MAVALVGDMPRLDGKNGSNRVLRWRTKGPAVDSSGGRNGVVRGVLAPANARRGAGPRSSVLGGGRDVRGGEDRFDCEGSTRKAADGSNVELSSRRTLPVKPPKPYTRPYAHNRQAKPGGPPKGRPPRHHVWDRDQEKYVPCTNSARMHPYVPPSLRPAPAPRGRPPEGQRWDPQKSKYVAKEAPAEVGNDRFDLTAAAADP